MKTSTKLLIITSLILIVISASVIQADNHECNLENAFISSSLGYGLNCLDENGWHSYTTGASTLPVFTPQQVALCPSGQLAILHALGLTLFDGTNWEDYPKGDWFAPKAMSCGADGHIWVAHMKGVNHYDGTAWANYDLDQFGSDSRIISVEDVAIGADGSVWALTQRSVAQFVDGAWTVYENGNGYDQDYWLQGLAVDGMGLPWLVHTTGLLHFDGTSWQNIEQRGVQMIVADGERLWGGSLTAGLSLYEGGSWQAFDRNNSGIASVQVRDIAVDGQGRVWVGTEWGLSVFDGETWTTYLMSNSGLLDNTVNSIAVSGDGPPLPELEAQATGTISGIIELGVDPLPNVQVELCTESLGGIFRGMTPCEGMPGQMIVTTNENGEFVFADVPAGRYELAVETPDGWIHFIGAGSKIELFAGDTIDLADIDVGG